jgi:hypothetical protein
MSYTFNYKALCLYYKIKAFNMSGLVLLGTDDLGLKHMMPLIHTRA